MWEREEIGNGSMTRKPEPWELIPEGEIMATDLIVNGTPGQYFRSKRVVWIKTPNDSFTFAIEQYRVRTVTPLIVYPWKGRND